jgi:hypothetical protein
MDMRGLCILLLIASSCFAVAQAEEQQDYFPLQEGNSWTYRRKVSHDVDYLTITITHIQEIEGNTYYVFSDGKLYRKSPDGNVLEYQDGEERLLYDFTPEEGDQDFRSYEYTPADWEGIMWRLNVDHIVVSAGEFHNGYEFHYSTHGTELGIHIYLFPSVGMVRYVVSDSMFGTHYRTLSLVHATVNGKQYGTSVEESRWGELKSLFR